MAKRLSLAILLAACAATLQAQPVQWDDGRLYERLGLTDQQVSSIQEIVAREDKVIREA